MSLRDLDLKSAYETYTCDPVAEFYVPVLSEAVSYDRIAGFFSSTSLALAARGLAGLIRNGGHMRMLVCPVLSPADCEVVRDACANPEKYIEERMAEELEELEDQFKADHVRALGWMLANGLLEMRVAYVSGEDIADEQGLFHQKVGIVRDASGDALSFSGSVNETASGWLYNVEEFKVFRSSDSGQNGFYEADQKKFEEFWDGSREYVNVFEPEHALKERLIRLGSTYQQDALSLKKYEEQKAEAKALEEIGLFFYQKEAVEKWRSNNYRLLFEMATGTGKTRTAIACINLLLKRSKKFVCVVSTPETTLSRQWQKEIEKLGVCFDRVVFADSTGGGSKKWSADIRDCLGQMKVGIISSLLVLTTHASSSGDTFTDLFRNAPESLDLCFVGDEVHGLGAPKQRNTLLEAYKYRIGLSATPSRWFDEEGTELLKEYFGDDSFVFTVRDAQSTINPLTGETFLTPYEYRLIFVSLNDEEFDEYSEISKRIAVLQMKDGKTLDEEEQLKTLMLKRAGIVKNAEGKLSKLYELVENEGLEKALIFTSPQQIEKVQTALSSRWYKVHPFTEKQSAKRSKKTGGMSEREMLIEAFKAGHLDALIAITCLDEGIDIPLAEKAILLASSTNPREYIQRIGRVVRRYPGKEKAVIYDFVVVPDIKRLADETSRRSERRILRKELNRVREMADNALNSVDVLLEIDKRMEALYGGN